MKKLKSMLCLGLTGCLTFSLAACGSKKVSYEPLPEDDDTVYNITMVQSSDNAYYNTITQGFNDALIDLFGEAHVNLNVQTASPQNPADAILLNSVSQNTQLIFANGDSSLAAATALTDTIPIVGAGVMDYERALHIIVEGDDTWDRRSETNVTGISALPPMDDQLSLLIEATPNLETVGILYSADDANAIYQNEIIENYLDEAGIPWKEYELPASDAEIAANAEINTSSAITPSKMVAPSAKEGSNLNIDSIGESGLINGLNAPESARTPKVSSFWYGPKGTPKPAADTVSESGSATDNPPADNPPVDNSPADDAAPEDIITYACSQCSALFIPSESYLTDQVPMIRSIATTAGVTTTGGDSTIGANTLVSLFTDPYNNGYAAGKLAYRILVNAENPGDIRISTANGTTVKLYNNEIATQLEMSFPKSFSEIGDYFTTYETGSLTERITSEDEK